MLTVGLGHGPGGFSADTQRSALGPGAQLGARWKSHPGLSDTEGHQAFAEELLSVIFFKAQYDINTLLTEW